MLDGQILFWASVLLLAYTHLGYPVLMRAWAVLRPRSSRRASVEPFEPPVTLLVVAHNEALRIGGRIENLLSLDYPPDRLEILVASDGSTDRTAERARAYEQAGVKIVEFERRRGKPAVLNELVRKASGEIVVLADARQRFEREVLRALVCRFRDPEVGAVSGELILTQNAEGTSVGEGMGFYWRYEKFIRSSESIVDSGVGATGAVYAVRRDLFEPVAEDTILDDVLIPMRIVCRGYRVLFEPRARAYDQAAATGEEEFTRKVRTIAGNFQLLARERWLLNPLCNRLWLQTVSHKALRLLTPLLLATALGTSLFLASRPLYGWLFFGQIGFYGAALGGYFLRDARRKLPFLIIPYVICLLSWATVVAFFRYLTRRQSVLWERTSPSRWEPFRAA
jgi:cellulose synthase/poly-beta-1,6-N-acetylglucosamine synthase-like glycosyltransferase